MSFPKHLYTLTRYGTVGCDEVLLAMPSVTMDRQTASRPPASLLVGLQTCHHRRRRRLALPLQFVERSPRRTDPDRLPCRIGCRLHRSDGTPKLYEFLATRSFRTSQGLPRLASLCPPAAADDPEWDTYSPDSSHWCLSRTRHSRCGRRDRAEWVASRYPYKSGTQVPESSPPTRNLR